MCDCVKLTFDSGGDSYTYNVPKVGEVNGKNQYVLPFSESDLVIEWDGTQWVITFPLEEFGLVVWSNTGDTECPFFETWTNDVGDSVLNVSTTDCGVYIEDRDFFEYKSIKLPSVCTDQDRGLDDCCCEELVLALSTSNSWQTDKTSAWMKLSSNTDSVNFRLYKDGVLTTFTPTAVLFPNEPFTYYTTINWIDVLTLDGAGCYELKISYNVSGIQGVFTWGKYRLLPFTIQNALKTARIRVNFDGYHEIEQINFTGSGIESTFRFYGYIGNRQPNTEIDNIIYNNREMKRVIRENLNEYEILVDPSLKCVTQPLVDLYLLSENNLYISDYNAHNHDYCLNDLPVIVSQSPELTYYDFSRKASLKCVVADKFKNKRTYY